MKHKYFYFIFLIFVPIEILAYCIPIYELENNNDTDIATSLPYNYTIKKGNISSISDIDWYTLSIDQPSGLTIEFKHLYHGYQYNLFIVKTYNSALDVLSQTTIEASDERTVFDAGLGEAGSYYISVETACITGYYCDYYRSDEYQIAVSIFNADDYYLETEPNDTIASSDDYFNGGVVTGQISTVSDEDYYTITTEGAADINISFYHDSFYVYTYTLFYVEVTDTDGTVLNHTDIDATEEYKKFGFSVMAAGDYYIRVTGCQSGNQCNIHRNDQYKIKTLISPIDITHNIPIYELEPNDDRINATLLPYSYTIKRGDISSHGDIDWYKISTKKISSLTIEFNLLHSSTYYNLFIVKTYNSALDLLSQKTIDASDEITIFEVGLGEAGDYYISVETACDDPPQTVGCRVHLTDEYQIAISVFNTDDYYLETEPNNTIDSADNYHNGGVITGQISTPSDIDYYILTTEGAANINLGFYHPKDGYIYNLFYVEITDSDGTVLNSTDSYAPHEYTKFGLSVMEAGDYYIKVTGCQSSDRCDLHGTDPYEIKTLISPMDNCNDPIPIDDRIVVTLEEPAANSTVSGVGNLRGWAVGPNGIDYVEFYIDGILGKQIPYGAARGDVANAYPNFPDSRYSGFSQAYAYGIQEPGTHTLTVRAVSPAGDYKEATNTFEVTRFHKGYFSNPNAMDISSSSCSRDETGFLLNNLLVEGIPYNVRLEWQVPSQQFSIVNITTD